MLCAPAENSDLLQNRLELALSHLWAAMQGVPNAVRDAFQNLHEPDIAHAADARAANLQRSEPDDWTPDLAAGAAVLVRAVAVEIRALDKALHECREPGRSDDPNQDFLAYGGADVFIVPRLERSRPGRRGQAFARRGLMYHRILPARIEDLAVRLYSPSLFGPGADGSETDLVSAIFPKAEIRVELDGEDKAFRITALTNEAALSDIVAQQLTALRDTGPSMAAVWPELVVSPSLRSTICGRLQDLALEEPAIETGFVVAGSWHEERDGGRINSALVVSGDGMPLFEVLKRERFELAPGVLEQIVPGEELPILLYGDVLIAFGICKDFCEQRHATPYPQLDVDLVIVPSLGNAQTMRQHHIAAQKLDVIYGARTFVVQQLLPRDDGSDTWGLVLRPPEALRDDLADPQPQHILLDRSRISCTIA